MNEVQSIKLKNGSTVTLRPAKGEDAKGITETIRSSSDERSSLILEMHGKHIGPSARSKPARSCSMVSAEGLTWNSLRYARPLATKVT